MGFVAISIRLWNCLPVSVSSNSISKTSHTISFTVLMEYLVLIQWKLKFTDNPQICGLHNFVET